MESRWATSTGSTSSRNLRNPSLYLKEEAWRVSRHLVLVSKKKSFRDAPRGEFLVLHIIRDGFGRKILLILIIGSFRDRAS
eukprot:982817-Pelagomonas_calceolata.AAC.1